MKSENQVRERLQKAYEMLEYYWSYLPEYFPEEHVSSRFAVPATIQADMLVDRARVASKHRLVQPRNIVEAAKGFNEAITACVMLEWVLESGNILARKGD
jgi:hypothetical protein